MLNHDNFFVGVTVALILTIATAVVIILLAPIIYSQFSIGEPNAKLLLLSIAPALVMMRYFFRKRGFGKSGSGAVLVIFLSVILYFLFIANKLDSFPLL